MTNETERPSAKSEQLISSLGKDSLISKFYRSLPDTDTSAYIVTSELKEELLRMLPLITDNLANLENHHLVNNVGLTQAVLKSFGVELTVEQVTNKRIWSVRDLIHSREEAAHNLRELAAKVDLYNNPGCANLIDWLDEDLQDQVRIIPIGNGVYRYRHIGNVSRASVMQSLKEYKQRLGYEVNASLDSMMTVVIEDYSELDLPDIGEGPSQADDDMYGIDAPTIPGNGSYRASNLIYIAVGMHSIPGWNIFLADAVASRQVALYSDYQLGLAADEVLDIVDVAGPIMQNKRLESAFIVAREIIANRTTKK